MRRWPEMELGQQQKAVESEQRVWQETRIITRGYPGLRTESTGRRPQRFDVTDKGIGYKGGEVPGAGKVADRLARWPIQKAEQPKGRPTMVASTSTQEHQV